MKSELSSYRGYRFPSARTAHAVWLHFRFGQGF